MPSLGFKPEDEDPRDSIGRSNSGSDARSRLGGSISRSNASRFSTAG